MMFMCFAGGSSKRSVEERETSVDIFPKHHSFRGASDNFKNRYLNKQFRTT